MRTLKFVGIALVTSAVSGCFNGGAQHHQLQRLDRVRLAVRHDTVNFEINGYCPAQGRIFRDLFVRNLSNHVVAGELLEDRDHDGVADRIESGKSSLLDIRPGNADSNGDGYGDLLMYLSGIVRAQQPLLRCQDFGSDDGMGLQVAQGSQFVGLRNCEKSFLRLERDRFDTDGDGVPDFLELRCGMNPNDRNDALLDPDGDGVANIEECKISTPVMEHNSQPAIAQFAYEYRTEVDSTSGCNRLTVNNIALNAQPNDLIGLYLTEDDSLEIRHLYTAYFLVTPELAGRTIEIEFGPQPAGRFVVAK